MEKFSYLQRGNLEYIEQEYQKYLENPDGAPEDWRLFFEGVEFAQNFTGKSAGEGSVSAKEINVHE